jgi:hypothetical protein
MRQMESEVGQYLSRSEDTAVHKYTGHVKKRRESDASSTCRPGVLVTFPANTRIKAAVSTRR